jgi:hypothetical protein
MRFVFRVEEVAKLLTEKARRSWASQGKKEYSFFPKNFLFAYHNYADCPLMSTEWPICYLAFVALLLRRQLCRRVLLLRYHLHWHPLNPPHL